MDTNIRILSIDDEPLVLDMLKATFNSLGITNIETAEDGTAAMELVKANEYDLIVLDINLPDTDGITLLSDMLKFNYELYIVMLTGAATAKNIKNAANLGAKDFIVKPFNKEKLQKILNNFNRRRDC